MDDEKSENKHLKSIIKETEFYNNIFQSQCEFIANSFQCESYDELLDALNLALENHSRLDWHCSLFIKTDEGEVISKTGGHAVVSATHQQIVKAAWDRGDTIQSGNFAVIPSKKNTVGILLRNLPEDPLSRETTISSMSQILDIFESRLYDFKVLDNLRKVVSLSYEELNEEQEEYSQQAETLSILLSRISEKAQENDIEAVKQYTLQTLGEISKFDLVRQKKESVTRRLYNALHPETVNEEDENLDVKKLGGSQDDIDNLLADLGL